MAHRSSEQLEAGLDVIEASPIASGRLALIVRRPAVDLREVVEHADLDLSVGLVGDSWHARPTRSSPDGGPDPERQLTLMNARAAALIAGSPADWPDAGDQLYVDLHLGTEELPAGTRLRVGEAVVEITPAPHRGCAKFTARFGLDAMRFVNSEVGQRLNLRGVNAKVVVPGRIAVGDAIEPAGELAATSA